MPRKSSYALADGDVHEPKLNNRSKKHFNVRSKKPGPLPLRKFFEELDGVSCLDRPSLMRQSMLAMYGTRTDKKVTDPRRRNKKKQLKARQFDRLCKLDEQMEELYSIRYHPSSYHYRDVMFPEEIAREEEEALAHTEVDQATCGKVEIGEAPLKEKSAKIEEDDALNEVAAEKPLLRLRRSRSVVVNEAPMSPMAAQAEEDRETRRLAVQALAVKAGFPRAYPVEKVEEKEESSSDTSSLYKMSEVSSEEGWTMA